MDPIRIGLSLRALRIRRRWRQIHVAVKAGVSRGTISNIERGLLGQVSVATLAKVAMILGADLQITVRWHGAELDRLLDAGHAALVDEMAQRLRGSGWDVEVEVTFSIWGERGLIDVFAFRRVTGDLLVVEVKTVVPDFQATVSALDRKARLAQEIGAGRGWDARRISRLLVIERGSTSRDRLRRIGHAVDVAFPDRGAVVRRWLRSPSGPMSGLLFVRSATGDRVAYPIAGRQRVHHAKRARSASGGCVSRAPRPACGSSRA